MVERNHISFTEPHFRATMEGLLAASARWGPMPSRLTLSRDYTALEQVPPLGGLPRIGAGETTHSQEIVVSAILDIINSPRHRKGPDGNLLSEGHENVELITKAVAAGRPIRMVIPSFPGRPHNIATHRRVSPDLGEAYALALLADIHTSVAAIYPPGVHVVIILDGKAYRPFYGYAVFDGHAYPDDLQTMINEMGFQGTISLVDLQDLIDARRPEFDFLVTTVRKDVEKDWNDPSNNFKDLLVNSMRLGTDNTPLAAALIETIKNTGRDFDYNEVIRQMRSAVESRANHTAFEYSVLLTTIRSMHLIQRAFPDALRGTVHPKPGQYSPHLTHPETTIAPWHGVGVVMADGSITSMYESAIYQNFEKYRAVFVQGEYAPFYYEVI